MIPASFEKDLKPEEVIWEENGVPFAWGRHIKNHLGDERFAELRSQCRLEHLGDYFSHLWAVVTRQLTPDECVDAAIKKYGPVTKLKLGPRGGFQYVEYGGKSFWSSEFYPRDDMITDDIIEKDPPSPAMVALAQRNKRKKAAKERAKARKLAKKEKA